MNPLKGLFRSRKFWLYILNGVVSLTTFFVGRYVAPDHVEEILIVLGFMSGVAAMVIHGITSEDVATKSRLNWEVTTNTDKSDEGVG